MTMDGKLEAVADLPCSWPTSCTFGGPDLSVLYVTSARFRCAQIISPQTPKEGALFAINPGVKGRPPYLFGASP
jgi:sugar lactone lactonase YvrE